MEFIAVLYRHHQASMDSRWPPIAWWSKSRSGSRSVRSAGENGSPSSPTDRSSAAMRRQSVMNSASVTIPPIVMDAAAQSAILLTPLMQLQMIESGAEAGFRLEAETLASAPPREPSGDVRQSVFVRSEVVTDRKRTLLKSRH